MPPFLPVETPSFAATLNPPLSICAPPEKIPPHIKPSTKPLKNPFKAPSKVPVDMPPAIKPIPALIPALIPVWMVDVNSAEPNAAQKPVPVPAVIAVMNAPTISTPKPIKSFCHQERLPSLSMSFTGLFKQ